MSISGAKTAIVLAVSVVIGIAAISLGLGMLDVSTDTGSSDVLSPAESQDTETPQPAKIDKSRFKMAPELVGIADYINTSPEELQPCCIVSGQRAYTIRTNMSRYRTILPCLPSPFAALQVMY